MVMSARRGGTIDPAPKGPSRAERELWEMTDLIRAKVGKLPPDVEWRQLAIVRTAAGLRCQATI